MPNVPLLAAFAALSGVIRLESVVNAIESVAEEIWPLDEPAPNRDNLPSATCAVDSSGAG